jgi:uncharacterized cupin superfamily protein
MSDKPAVVHAAAVEAPAGRSLYPSPFAERMAKRTKRKLGDLFGLTTFGVNLTELAPGGESALMHCHSKQDEFVYVVSGELTLVTEAGEHRLAAGMCAGFPAGGGAHMLVNRSDGPAAYLEIGDRAPGDEVHYPSDDIKALSLPGGGWAFSRKDGTPY